MRPRFVVLPLVLLLLGGAAGLPVTDTTLGASSEVRRRVDVGPPAFAIGGDTAMGEALTATVGRLPAPVELSAPTADPALDAALVDLPAAVAATDTQFRLPVPFRTQKDGSRFQGSNCGPAALAMVLEAYGIVQSNDELRTLTHTYQGTVGRRGGTALQHVATVGGDFGLQPIGLYQGGDFHRWTADEIRGQVQAGRVVIPLVKYRLLPGHEDSAVRYDHYIVVHGLDGDRLLYHDPAYEDAERGEGRWITMAQLEAALAPTWPARQAVAFAGGQLGQLPALGL